MSTAAFENAHNYAWPLVAQQVLGAYEDAIAAPAPAGRLARAKVEIGAATVDPAGRRGPQRRLPSLERDERTRRERTVAGVRRGVIALVALAAVAVSALAVERIGVGRITSALVTSKPSWVVIGCALMCAAMDSRGFAWHAILRAALPVRGSGSPTRCRAPSSAC